MDDEGNGLVTSGFDEVKTLEELENKVGFEVDGLEELPYEIKEVSYIVMDGGLAQVTYIGESQTIIFRKSKGAEDNSGDYNNNQNEKLITVGDVDVFFKGWDIGYSNVTWTNGGFSYSLVSQEKLQEDSWVKIVTILISQ